MLIFHPRADQSQCCRIAVFFQQGKNTGVKTLITVVKRQHYRLIRQILTSGCRIDQILNTDYSIMIVFKPGQMCGEVFLGYRLLIGWILRFKINAIIDNIVVIDY